MNKQSTTKKSGHYALCLKEFKIAASITMAYILLSCAVCGALGYGKSGSEIAVIAGIPSWALFGVVIPWVVMVVITAIYGFVVMKGDDQE